MCVFDYFGLYAPLRAAEIEQPLVAALLDPVSLEGNSRFFL